jgi:hypothetical protein
MTEPAYESCRWGRVPAWWLQHPATNLDLIGVLSALSTYADKDGYCEPSQATIARQLQRSRPWVNRVIADLTSLGFIEKEARHRRHNNGTTSCRYRLLETPPQRDTPVNTMTDRVITEDTPRHLDDTTHLPQEHKQSSRTSAYEEQSITSSSLADEPAACPASTSQNVDIPEDWKPSSQATKRASELYPEIDLAVHATMFVHKCRAKDYRCIPNRVDDLWLSWVATDRLRDDRDARSRPRNADKSKPARNPAERAEERFDAWAMAAITTANRHGTPGSKQCQ